MMESKKTVETTVKGKKVTKQETVMEAKDMVSVKDTSAFLDVACRKRGLNPANTLVLINLDSGGGSLKVVATLSEGSGVAPASKMEEGEEEEQEQQEEVEEEEAKSEKSATNSKPAFKKKLLTGS